MAGEVLNISNLTIIKHRCKLKDLCFKTATKPYTHRYGQAKKEKQKMINLLQENIEMESQRLTEKTKRAIFANARQNYKQD